MMLPRKWVLASALTLTTLLANPLYAETNTNNNASKLTKPEINTLATIASIDKSEILLSVIATNKRPNSSVNDFAKMMIEQHGNNLTEILNMASGASLGGSEAEKLSTAGKKEMTMLGKLSDKEFDKAYVDAMVKGHQGALDLIDKHLMKTAKSEEMKQFMTTTRETVAHHLEDAKKLQADMQS